MKKRKMNFIKLGIFLFGISLLLWNCEQENIETPNLQNTNLDFNLENLTFNQANNESVFSELKTKFKIEEPIYNPKKKKYFSKVNNTYSKSSSSNDFSDLDPSIDVSVVRKITTPNYVSYTMRINEPQNATNSFSNIVIQENNGVQEIFTFRYTPTENISSSNKNFEGTYTMSRGMCLPDQNGEDCNGNPDDGGGGTDDFVEICNDVTVITIIPCGCGHTTPCSGSTCGGPLYASYALVTQQECYWDYQGSTGTTGNTGTGDTGNPNNGGGSPSGSDGNVITTPITEILPEGALESIVECVTPNQSQTDWLNNELANNSSNVVSIWNYINENSCDTNTQEVITESIDEDIISVEEFEDIFKRKKECKKIKKLFDAYPVYKQKLIDLAATVNQNHENGKFIDNSSSTVQDIPQGTGGKIDINLNPSSPYVTIAHTHDALGSGIGTYSVFSFSDLLVLSSLAKKGKIKTNKFVTILITAKGTRYALTINNATKFKNFFYNLGLDVGTSGVVNMDKFREMERLSEKYYLGDDAVIKEDNSDNNAVQIAFLKLLQNNDTGVSVFTANTNFDRFENLKLEDDNTSVTPNNCNN